MNERPFNIALTAWADESFDGFVEVTTQGDPQNWTDWTDFEFLAAESLSATVAAFVGVITAAPGRLNLSVDEATLKLLLPPDHAADFRQFEYVVRAKPIGTYRVRLGYGKFRINKGLPEVAP